jgi:glycosyltransferase involved in cell wall biosynthesis
MPCFNQGEFLDAALQSVANQNYSEWECIIVNDGSTDNTEELALAWSKSDVRFKYFHKENGGLSSARNFGIEKARGQYLQFLDSDDCLDSEKLSLSVQCIKDSQDRQAKIVISDFRIFVENPLKSTEPYCILKEEFFCFEMVLFEWDNLFTIPIHCGFFHKSLFKDFRFNQEIKAKEDWIMWVRFFQQEKFSIFLNKPLALYRRNPKSMTMTQPLLEDYLKVYDYFKTITSPEDFHKLSKKIIAKYYMSSIYFKTLLHEKTHPDSRGLVALLKKGLKKANLLKPAKNIFTKMSGLLKK